MITRMTFGPVPPPGRYSSGSRGTLSARPAHPAAPSRDAPAAPAPAALRKSLRVNVLFGCLLTPGRPPHRSRKPALYQHFSTSAFQLVVECAIRGGSILLRIALVHRRSPDDVGRRLLGPSFVSKEILEPET